MLTQRELWDVLTVLDNPTSTTYLLRWHAREAVIRAIEAFEANDPYDKVPQMLLPAPEERAVREPIVEDIDDSDPP